MKSEHYVYMAVLIIVGYTIGMMWPTPGVRVRQLLGM